MSQPTYDRLVSHLERLGLVRAKEILPDVLKDAEQSADGHAAVLDLSTGTQNSPPAGSEISPPRVIN